MNEVDTASRTEDLGGPRTLTASETAATIGVSIATVRAWADRGLLPSFRTVGGHRRFEVRELKRWLAERGASMTEPGRRERGPDVPACQRWHAGSTPGWTRSPPACCPATTPPCAPPCHPEPRRPPSVALRLAFSAR